MRFVVLGAGALGTVIAAYLARAGKDVALIARGPRAEQLAQKGVTITGLENFTVEMEIVDQPGMLSSADVLMLATKTYDTAAAIDAVRHLKLGSVFSIQNGVMKNDQLAKAFGDSKVLGAVGMLGGSFQANGAANFMMANPFIVGELSGPISPRVEDIIGTLTAAKLPAVASDNILSEEWSKFVGWLGLSALSVLTRVETWKFLADEDTARVAARIAARASSLRSAGTASSRSMISISAARPAAFSNCLKALSTLMATRLAPCQRRYPSGWNAPCGKNGVRC